MSNERAPTTELFVVKGDWATHGVGDLKYHVAGTTMQDALSAFSEWAKAFEPNLRFVISSVERIGVLALPLATKRQW